MIQQLSVERPGFVGELPVSLFENPVGEGGVFSPSLSDNKKKKGTSPVPFSRWSPRVLSYRRAASTITSSDV